MQAITFTKTYNNSEKLTITVNLPVSSGHTSYSVGKGVTTETSTITFSATGEYAYSRAKIEMGRLSLHVGSAIIFNNLATNISLWGSYHSAYTVSVTNASLSDRYDLTKNHNTQTVSAKLEVVGYYQIYSSISVLPKTNYAVAYNANQGSEAPASQTKWYNEALTLRSGTPTRTGHYFQGWATSATGSVAYSAGGTYSANAAVILYAVWKPYEYTVTYDANSGAGAPQPQTKYYGTPLTIPSTQPTKDGYVFKGWATSTAIAGQGLVEYAAGSTYSANAAITLYAVWELAYHTPIINNLDIDRCDSNGTLDDDGKYAKVTFDWSIYSSENAKYYGGNTYPYANNHASCSITIGSLSATPTLAGTSGTAVVVVGNGTYDTDLSYAASVSITDSPTEEPSHTTTVTGSLLMAYFPMDYNEDASAIGFFMPAPDDEEGAFFGKDVCCEKDILLDLDDTQASGTDHDLITAINTLGWTDVFVN